MCVTHLPEAAQRVSALLAPGLLLQGSVNTIISRLNLFAHLPEAAQRVSPLLVAGLLL